MLVSASRTEAKRRRCAADQLWISDALPVGNLQSPQCSPHATHCLPSKAPTADASTNEKRRRKSTSATVAKYQVRVAPSVSRRPHAADVRTQTDAGTSSPSRSPFQTLPLTHGLHRTRAATRAAAPSGPSAGTNACCCATRVRRRRPRDLTLPFLFRFARRRPETPSVMASSPLSRRSLPGPCPPCRPR